MHDEYDQITAYHYAAYRPALHESILRKTLGNQRWIRGLDIGCGTGHSALALTQFCESVMAVDPSKAMLAQSIPHPQVGYQYFDGCRLAFPDGYFELITFAGSWYYAQSQGLLDEVLRVGKGQTRIVLYDFDIQLGSIIDGLLPKGYAKSSCGYDHQADFDGFIQSQLRVTQTKQSQLSLTIAHPGMAHLLLSVKDTYAALAAAYGQVDLHQKITQQLGQQSSKILNHVKANTYAKIYRNEQ
ncbi:MAG TPA: class I SAM-dependent methyltransferase [Saprospiraceae bacterium]|nr:class I SAM-dependent methyltransferase [Saprospiraceae bacterium]